MSCAAASKAISGKLIANTKTSTSGYRQLKEDDVGTHQQLCPVISSSDKSGPLHECQW